MGGSVPSMWMAPFPFEESIHHARHTCITFVRSGISLSSQSVNSSAIEHRTPDPGSGPQESFKRASGQCLSIKEKG